MKKLLIAMVCAVSLALEMNAQVTILGRTTSDTVMPGFWGQNGNANTTMTGLNVDATIPLTNYSLTLDKVNAAQFNVVGGKLYLVSGGVLTNWTASADPTAPLGLATKQYVDTATTSPGGPAGGELTGTYPNPTLVNAAVIGKVLSGLDTGTGGPILASDTILQAFGRVENRVALNDAKVTGADRVLRAGDTMTGPLVLSGDATAALHPVTLQQLQAVGAVYTNLFVNVDGDTMTGFLTLHADPVNPFHAATKQYVDAVIPSISYNTSQFSTGPPVSIISGATVTNLLIRGASSVNTASNPGVDLDVGGLIEVDAFRLPTGAQDGFQLTSDANGNASWQEDSLTIAEIEDVVDLINVVQQAQAPSVFETSTLFTRDNDLNVGDFVGGRVKYAQDMRFTSATLTAEDRGDINTVVSLQIGGTNTSTTLTIPTGGGEALVDATFTNDVAAGQYIRWVVTSGPTLAQDRANRVNIYLNGAPTAVIPLPGFPVGGGFAFNTASTTPDVFSPSVTKAGDVLIWNFGDGNSQTNNAASHTYASGGVKTVTGTATDSLGTILVLDLADVDGTNALPSAITNMTALTTLTAQNNSFGGSLPDLSGLTSLTTLQIDSNLFTGSFLEFTNANLRTITASSNGFTGSLPANMFNNWPNLDVFDVSQNALSGNVAFNGVMPSLRVLNVASNAFGVGFGLPAGVTALEYVDGSHNSFSGSLIHFVATGRTMPSVIDYRMNDNSLQNLGGAQDGAQVLGLGTVMLSFTNLALHNNLFDELSVDLLLDAMVTNAQSRASGLTAFVRLDGTGNSAPSNAGFNDRDILEAVHGWTVEVNGQPTGGGVAQFNTVSQTPESVTVQVLKTGNSAIWNWGDGSTAERSFNMPLQHFYANAGLKTIILRDPDPVNGFLSMQITNSRLTNDLPSLAAFTNLTNLTLANNSLSGSLSTLTNLTALQTLNIRSNLFSGTLPTWNSMRTLDASFNALSNTNTPVSFPNVLVFYDVSGNAITGDATPWIGQSGFFNAASNQLTRWQVGAQVSSSALNDVRLSDNLIDSITPSGSGPLSALQMSLNLTNLWLHNNLLPQIQVDSILFGLLTNATARLPGAPVCNVRLDGTGNAAPSATGNAAKMELISTYGWTVQTN